MNDAQAGPAYGRTNWRRFAVAVGIPAVAAGHAPGMANGAFAASFAVSGQDFKISADRLEGDGFAQYGGVVKDAQGKRDPGRAVRHQDGQAVQPLPVGPRQGAPMSLTITAGDAKGKPARATDLLIGVKDLGGDATFKNINIGQDAGTLKAGGAGARGETGAFGQQADSVTIVGLRQTAGVHHGRHLHAERAATAAQLRVEAEGMLLTWPPTMPGARSAGGAAAGPSGAGCCWCSPG